MIPDFKDLSDQDIESTGIVAKDLPEFLRFCALNGAYVQKKDAGDILDHCMQVAVSCAQISVFVVLTFYVY